MKILIITGASRGIGLATCKRFQEDGWQVYNLSRTPSPLADVHNLTVDLSKPDSIEAVCAPFLSKWKEAKRICLIHNAAASHTDTVETLELSVLLHLFQINIGAAVVLNQQVLPFLREGASILYIGSTLSEQGTAGVAGYITVKHAVVGLMRATCQDLAGRGIHTACICPGFTDTEMLRSRMGPDPAVRASIEALMSAGRLIDPSEIAELLFFSAHNPSLDGAVLHANLGQLRK
jgi:3-oxoacyl-[acyl-carrier protein] reductase